MLVGKDGIICVLSRQMQNLSLLNKLFAYIFWKLVHECYQEGHVKYTEHVTVSCLNSDAELAVEFLSLLSLWFACLLVILSLHYFWLQQFATFYFYFLTILINSHASIWKVMRSFGMLRVRHFQGSWVRWDPTLLAKSMLFQVALSRYPKLFIHE